MDCTTPSAGRFCRATLSRLRISPISSPWRQDRRLVPAPVEPSRLRRMGMGRPILPPAIPGSSATRPVGLLSPRPGPFKRICHMPYAIFHMAYGKRPHLGIVVSRVRHWPMPRDAEIAREWNILKLCPTPALESNCLALSPPRATFELGRVLTGRGKTDHY